MSCCLFLKKRAHSHSKSTTTTTTTTRRSYGICSGKKVSENDTISQTRKRDRISQLPDDILVSIIERLPIKSAIRTSILSKRWRNLHKYVPNINLNCSDLVGSHKCVSYKHYIYSPDRYNLLASDSLDKLFRLRSGSSILSFRLICCLTASDSKWFEQCIYSLGRSGIEKLDLAFYRHWDRDDHIRFPSHTLPKLPSLKYLQLDQFYLDPGLKSQCNSLETLSLSRVMLPPGAIECIMSNCSKLQTLTMSLCRSRSKLRFECPRLKNLAILGCGDLEEIELYATPNLVVLEVEKYKELDIIFGHVPQLQSAILDLGPKKHVVPCVARKLLTEVPHLKSFSLVTSNYNIYGGRNRATLPMEIPYMVSNLRRLDFSIRYTREDTDLVSMTTPLLQCCPFLQDFHLHVLHRHEDPRARGKKEAVVFYSELKKVEISGFVGTENDIEFALYILKSAPSLEDMYISRCSKIYDSVLGSWRLQRPSTTPWSNEVLRMIGKRLQGQAVSKAARVIIQHDHGVDNHGV